MKHVVHKVLEGLFIILRMGVRQDTPVVRQGLCRMTTFRLWESVRSYRKEMRVGSWLKGGQERPVVRRKFVDVELIYMQVQINIRC